MPAAILGNLPVAEVDSLTVMVALISAGAVVAGALVAGRWQAEAAEKQAGAAVKNAQEAGTRLRELLAPHLGDPRALTREPLLTEIVEAMQQDI